MYTGRDSIDTYVQSCKYCKYIKQLKYALK